MHGLSHFFISNINVLDYYLHCIIDSIAQNALVILYFTHCTFTLTFSSIIKILGDKGVSSIVEIYTILGEIFSRFSSKSIDLLICMIAFSYTLHNFCTYALFVILHVENQVKKLDLIA